MRYFKFFIFFILISPLCQADEVLQNEIYKNLRCLVCQGQTIADSNSDFAQTIKSVVKDKINEGMNKKQIYIFLADKYGEWILFKPPFNQTSYLLWMLPYLIFIVGVPVFFLIFRKKRNFH